jgi:hypothetical protein
MAPGGFGPAERRRMIMLMTMLRCAMARYPGRFLVLLWVTIGWLSAAAAAQGGPWKDYVYSDDAFAISSPVVPTVEKQKVRLTGSSAEARVYTMPVGESGAFMVFVVTRDASDQRSDQQVLDEARVGALRAAHAIVLVQSNITLGRYRGSQIDLQASEAEGKKRMRDRFFVVGRTLYQLMAIAPAGQPLPVGTGQWLDSFRLVGEGGG